MNIYLIRHAKVDMIWPKRCDSKEYDRLCQQYDFADIVNVEPITESLMYERIYVSSISRTHRTAEGLFPGKTYTELSVHEVPLRSYKDTKKKLPVWLWNVRARQQWFCNNNRQVEIKNETLKRCRKVIKELEDRNENCVIVSHGFFLKVFIKCLKSRGYSIQGNKTVWISNLQTVVAERNKD